MTLQRRSTKTSSKSKLDLRGEGRSILGVGGCVWGRGGEIWDTSNSYISSIIMQQTGLIKGCIIRLTNLLYIFLSKNIVGLDWSAGWMSR